MNEYSRSHYILEIFALQCILKYLLTIFTCIMPLFICVDHFVTLIVYFSPFHRTRFFKGTYKNKCSFDEANFKLG